MNNGSWELIETINNTADTISRRDVKNIAWATFKHFIDVQFKIEFHNWDADVDTPKLREFINDYDIIQWQWS